jgi:hypothetical protein
MPFILIFIGAILIVAAFNNTQGDLATALEADVPPFLKWGLAVGAIGGLGWVPGLATLSRWLLALVFTVIVLKNYQQIISGFQALGGAGGSTAAAAANPAPAAAYIANPNAPQFTQASISGTTAGTASGSSAQAGNINAAAGGTTTVASSPFGAVGGGFDPQFYLAAFELGFGGFGGVA